MVDTIQTGSSLTARIPDVTVYTANNLKGPWTLAKNLFCDMCRFSAGPEIGTAQLSYRYGPQTPLRETARRVLQPINLNGKFVKLVIDGDEYVRQPWFGRIGLDQRSVLGSVTTQKPSGEQTFIAYDLKQLLWDIQIDFAQLLDPDDTTTTLRIKRGLAFNGDPSAEFPERGNRSAEKYTDGDGDEVYAWSQFPRGQAVWTAQQALEYLLYFHAANSGYEWELSLPPNSDTLLSWEPFNLDTDRRRLLDVISQLIDRRRGAGWHLEWDPLAAKFLIHVFSFSDQPLTSNGETLIPANPNKKRLDFENAFDVQKAMVRYHFMQEFDTIIFEGARETSTFTVPLSAEESETSLVPDWTAEDEADYKAAASGETGYDDLDPDEKYRRNALWRSQRRLAHVYSRFHFAADWSQKAHNVEAEEFYWVSAVADDFRNVSEAATGEPLWTAGARFLRELPLLERLDYSGTRINDGTWPDAELMNGEYLRTLVFVPVGDGYDFLDRLVAAEDDEPRGWACHVRVSDRGPYLELKVSEGLNHFIAKTRFSGAAGDVDPEHDPENRRGLDFTDFQATVCLELDRRVSEVRSPFGLSGLAGFGDRVLRVQIPDARLDWVAPGTWIDIADDDLLTTESGGYVRDDRPRLSTLADLAANWYSRQRTALELEFKQFDELFELGWLITDIGPNYNPPDTPLIPLIPGVDLTLNGTPPQNVFAVNAPVTAITYDFVRKEQRVETSYAELDFAR